MCFARVILFVTWPANESAATTQLSSVKWPLWIFQFTICPGNQGDPAFHVVVPSLPGYGFSSAPQSPGFGVIKTAETFNQLMLSLGYTKYVAQGMSGLR